VIGRAQVLPLLVAACPSFRAAHPAIAIDESGMIDPFEQLGAFAHHLVDLAADGRADELPAVFAVVEDVLADGDGEAVTFVRTGLIEDIQNITSHRDVTVEPDAFVAVLGPAAAEVWQQLDESWTAAAAERASREPAEDYLLLGATDRRRMQSMTRELPDGTLARPSDVLRYEAHQYDETLTEFRRFIRRSIVWFLLAALIALAIVWAFA
jgi:hypothetical protein